MLSRTFSLTLPMALPLKKTSKKPIRRYEDYDDKGKDTKISKIFQLAVTTLSFLAFGGYLMTLIITAIRRNSNNGGTDNVIVFSVTMLLENFIIRFVFFLDNQVIIIDKKYLNLLQYITTKYEN